MKRGFLNQSSKQAPVHTNPYISKNTNEYAQKDKLLQIHHQETTYVENKQFVQVYDQHNSISKKGKQTKINMIKKIKKWQRRFYLNQILQYIFEVADRNEVYRSNFIHAHIPFVIIFKLLNIQIKTSQQTYLKEVIKVLINKIKQNNLKAQLNKKQHFDQFMIIAANPDANQQQLLNFLRKFIEQNKEIMKGFIPYYYNYFALVVNKQIVFNCEPGELIEYTIDYKHEELYKQNLTHLDIKNILDVFETKLVQKYHSDDI